MLSPVPTAHRDLVGVSSLLVGHGFWFGFILGRRAINGLLSKKWEMEKVEGGWMWLRLEMLVVEEELLVLARSVGGWVIFPFLKRTGKCTPSLVSATKRTSDNICTV